VSFDLRLDERFTFHPAKGDQAERYECVRENGRMTALALSGLCPASPELTMAINHIDQAVMWANAAIARNE